MKDNPIIGIIGGTGVMGQMFKRFFEDQGFKVLIASRKTDLSIEDCARSCDVVIISVPINVTIKIIERVGPLVKKEGLLMDLTSLKVGPVKAMLQSSSCSVLGAHPVFGPGLKNFKNQTIVLCPARGIKWQRWLEKLLLKNEAKLKICTPSQHDKMMAVIQGMIHFTTITISHVLKEMKIDIAESLDFSSPIYKLRLDMLGRILNQEPRLYGNIEIMNPETPKVLKKYLKTSKKLFDIIKEKDIEKFISYFNEAAEYLGDFKKEAEDYSNYIINMLVKKS
ncbi:MAG: prephenate dehydrogenase/arogenate dehydrogenase family protein [Spirochaetes bacterium]|nr:prephenate dehydrogenase/arogenate dehydrogenase family protein [Spirochaetota bacterium]